MDIYVLKYKDPLWENVISYAGNCPWRAGSYLARMMREGRFKDWERVIAAFEGTDPAGFCAFTEYDFNDAAEPEIRPYIGFVFVGEDYRGCRLSQRLTETAEEYARSLGYREIYLTSGEKGLYEKYGYSAAGEKMTGNGTTETLFRKLI